MKKIMAGAMLLFVFMLSVCEANKGETITADTVVYGTIFTAEKENAGLAEAFAVKDGKFVYVGDRSGVKAYIKKGVTKLIDNTGKGLIIPACTEGHGHFVGIDALMKMLPGLNYNYDQLLAELKAEMNSKDKPKYFLSWGLDYMKFMLEIDPDKSYAEEIEAIAPGVPVVFIDSCGHQALCNTTALKKAGFLDGKEIKGGVMLRNKKGEPSGWINDILVPYVLANSLDLSTIEQSTFEQACKNAVNTLHKRGFTNYFDAYINFLSDDAFLASIKKLDEAGELGANIGSCHAIRRFDFDVYKEKIDNVKLLAEKYQSKHFDPFNIKLFADGVVEAGTGWIFGEYPNAEKGKEHGNIEWSQEELNQIVKYANSKGILVHTHAFGDAAVNAVINAYINANDELMANYRNTLAHVRNITEEDKQRAAKNEIYISENLIWHCNDTPDDDKFDAEFELFNSRTPEGMYEAGYPMKSLTDLGIVVSSSTDAPCAEAIEGNIMNIIEVATTGMDPSVKTRPFTPKELLTVREALECLTINGARQMGIADKSGSIKTGKNADFVILDTNFLDYKGAKLRTIHNVKIKNLYFEGKNVYEN